MSRFRLLHPLLIAGGACCLLLAGANQALAQQYDPSNSAAYDTGQATDPATTQDPGRVARVAYLSGQVQFAPAGEDDWGSVEVNRPMVLGDRLLTGDDGLAALELGDASVRVDNDSAFDFLNLSQDNVQVELSQGTLNLAVHQLGYGENFEVDTPTIAFVAAAPGVYRIDNNPDGTGSIVTVFRGSGTVYGANGASRQVDAGQSYRFNDSALTSVDVNGLPQADAFDRFCEARDENYNRYAQQQQDYVPPDMIGGDELYQYGQWNDEPQYGNVWFPTSVAANWAPYRDGHWAWIDPWGWTWVDNQPWGFAPFHYGRWVYVRNRWGWMPGSPRVRPVYAPALVAFIGGSGLSVSLRVGGGGPVGWFPLGPRDVYVPWFHASRRYFDRVNVTNIRNVYVNQTIINNVYNDYSHNRFDNLHRYNGYAYREKSYAVTAVPRNVFTGARPIRSAALHLDQNQLARIQAVARPGVVPGKSSLGVRQPQRRIVDVRGNRPFAQPVVARHAPAPRPVSFSAREKAIASQHGQPLTPVQMQDLRKQRPATQSQPERVRLVPALAGAAAGAAALGAAHRATPNRGNEPRPATPRGPYSTQPFKNTVHPIPARVQPDQPVRRPGELPSAGFAHPGQTRNTPRPATGTLPPERLPVVRPVERAPQGSNARATQAQQAQQREIQAQAQQRSREAQMQQQREAQAQAQQRSREAQMQQQREAQAQAQQRVREQQMQQQRQVQMQAQQRAREQQVQQQRQVQMQAQQRAREQSMQQRQSQQYQREQPRHEPPPKKHPRDSSDNDRQH